MMGTKDQGKIVPARHPMRRTTSMTEFAPPDVLADMAEEADEETELQVLEEAAEEVAYGLCNRRLGPGRDTFMYRGDTAFCSLECREQHITHEEWKDKCALATSKPTPVMADMVASASASSDKPTAEATLAAA